MQLSGTGYGSELEEFDCPKFPDPHIKTFESGSLTFLRQGNSPRFVKKI